MTQTLKLESVSDFASYWTSAEYEKGVQTDIVQQIADVSLPSSKLQIARLRAAWKLAQDQGSIKASPANTTTDGPVVGMGWTSPEVTTSSSDGLWEALIFKARNPAKSACMSTSTPTNARVRSSTAKWMQRPRRSRT